MINRSIQKMIAIALVSLGLICGVKGVSAAHPLAHSPLWSNVPRLSLRSTAPISLAGQWLFQPDTKADAADASVLSLAPANPQMPVLPVDRWQSIAVPSNWYLQGQNIAGTAWYQYRFKPEGDLHHKVVKLTFDGIDYAADVWLNGQYLGFHEGYFQPFSFIVTDSLKPGQINELTVRVNSPRELEQTDWSLHKRLIKGIFAHHDARPGGAWTARSQDDNTGGIWAPVSFQISEQVAIDAVKITPHIDVQKDEAIAEVDLTVTVPASTPKNTIDPETPEKVQATLQLIPDNFSGQAGQKITTPLHLHPGENHISVQINQASPHLWWTWDHGKPDLYRLEVQLANGSKILDHRREVFGFRSIEYEQKSKVWFLNGQRIFVRGANYIATQWLSEMTRQKYQRDVDLITQANINAVRVHGHINAQPFYELCDRAGLLIWQDFPLQWGYRDDPEFAAEALSQAKDMIAVLYNHPSIVAWSLHNEPPWDADWMKGVYKHYDPDQNKFLDDFLYSHLKDTDSSRYLHPVSSTHEHPWWGWYSNSYLRYAEPTVQPLITEFGAQALPSLPSLKKIFSDADLFPTTEASWAKWKYHNFQARETFEVAGVKQGKNTAEFIQNTQQYQAEVIQFAAEAYRRQRFQPVSAIFQFMLLECWPSVNWGAIDYWRHPKPGYDALKVAYQPVLPSIDRSKQTWKLGESVDLKVWLINDLWKDFPKSIVTYRLHHPSQPDFQHQVTVDLAADQGMAIEPFSYRPADMGSYQLDIAIADQSGKLLGQNQLDFTVASPS